MDNKNTTATLTAVILAAGQGVRMRSDSPKVLHKLYDKPMVQYVIDAARKAGAEKTVVVVGHQAEQVMAALPGADFAQQKEQLGTGHAVMTAQDHFPDEGNILVLYGDTPLVTAEGIGALLQAHEDAGADATVVSVLLDNPAGYGRIVREKGAFKEIIEDRDLQPDQRPINEINTGVYCFKAKALKHALSKLDNKNAQAEYYITDTMGILLNDGYMAGVHIAPEADDFYGINSRVQLAEATQILKKRINRRHMLNGVTLADPDNTHIGPDVAIGQDTTIYPGTVIEGRTTIGSHCFIGANCRIQDSVIADHVEIQQSVVTQAEVGAHTTVGPFAYLRPKAKLGEHVKIGDFVEVKNAVIGDGTKASHLTYIGDAQVGKNINFGCGTVIVNYDGANKYQTVIGDNVFVGCNSNLVAPVTVEEGAYIAAGSTITEGVPENALAIARARQVNKIGWKRKEKK